MIPFLIEAAKIMDELFWYEAYGNRDSLVNALTDKQEQNYVRINYGPWDRLENNEPFIAGVGPKPEGLIFTPQILPKRNLRKPLYLAKRASIPSCEEIKLVNSSQFPIMCSSKIRSPKRPGCSGRLPGWQKTRASKNT
jgi:hypothetical protein